MWNNMVNKNTTEIEMVHVRVSRPWIELIAFCLSEVQHGDIKVKIVNGQPGKVLDFNREIDCLKRKTDLSKFSDVIEFTNVDN